MSTGVASDSAVSISGLQSGLDSDKIVDAAVKVAEQPIRHLDRQEAIVLSHKDTYTQLHSLMRGMQTSLMGMESHQAFGRLIASTSDSNVIVAKAGAGASPSSFRIDVMALAQVQRTYSDSLDSSTEPGALGQGTLQIDLGDETLLKLDVDDNTSLQDVADAINNTGAGASATIIFDGDQYRLQVTGANPGQASALTFTDSGLTLNLSEPSNTSQRAQDAQFRLDGFSTINRPTNIISDVIPGVTLSLGAVSDKTQIVSTSVDSAAIVSEIQQFVGSYNELISAVSQATHFDGQTDHSKSVGDTTLTALVRSLQSTVSSSVSGLSGDLRALSQAGVSLQKDGTMKVDVAKLDTAINKDPRALARLFVYDPSTQTRGVASKMQALVTRYTTTGTGTLTVGIESMTKQTDTLHVHKSRLQANVKKYEATLRDRYAKLEKQMSQIKSQTHYIDALKPQANKH